MEARLPAGHCFLRVRSCSTATTPGSASKPSAGSPTAWSATSRGLRAALRRWSARRFRAMVNSQARKAASSPSNVWSRSATANQTSPARSSAAGGSETGGSAAARAGRCGRAPGAWRADPRTPSHDGFHTRRGRCRRHGCQSGRIRRSVRVDSGSRPSRNGRYSARVPGTVTPFRPSSEWRVHGVSSHLCHARRRERRGPRRLRCRPGRAGATPRPAPRFDHPRGRAHARAPEVVERSPGRQRRPRRPIRGGHRGRRRRGGRGGQGLRAHVGGDAVDRSGSRSSRPAPTSSASAAPSSPPLMAMEVGKNRLEALGDVEESADLIRYYCHQMTEHDGFALPMGRLNPAEATSDVMRPVRRVGGDQPVQLPDGALGRADGRGARRRQHRRAQAERAGRRSPALMTCEPARRPGVPAGALHVVTGPGETVGPRARDRPATSTASRSPAPTRSGMELYRTLHPRPPEADDLRDGRQEPGHRQPPAPTSTSPRRARPRSAFGLQRPEVLGRVAGLRRAAGGRRVRRARWSSRPELDRLGDPLRPRHVPGPGRRRGRGRALRAGGRRRPASTARCTGRRSPRRPTARSAAATYLPPTVVEVPRDSLDLVDGAVRPADRGRRRSTRSTRPSTLANDTPLGLTAGLFSRRTAPRSTSSSSASRPASSTSTGQAGATTGAWPGVQPFGGWKGSGTNGKAGGGPYYVQQYLREQSRTCGGAGMTARTS